MTEEKKPEIDLDATIRDVRRRKIEGQTETAEVNGDNVGGTLTEPQAD